MNIWQYLDNKNKRKYLDKLITKIECDMKTSRAMTPFVEQRGIVKEWYAESERLEHEYQSLKEQLRSI